MWPVWSIRWVFVYELSGCGFESSWNHLNFRFHACYEQGVPWHSRNYRVWIHSEMRTWHDKYILPSHPALTRRGDIAATSLCTSQWRRRYVSNKTSNDVSMERREDVSMVRLYDVLLECHSDVSKGRNNDAHSLRLHDVSNKSQMKHPTTSR